MREEKAVTGVESGYDNMYPCLPIFQNAPDDTREFAGAAEKTLKLA